MDVLVCAACGMSLRLGHRRRSSPDIRTRDVQVFAVLRRLRADLCSWPERVNTNRWGTFLAKVSRLRSDTCVRADGVPSGDCLVGPARDRRENFGFFGVVGRRVSGIVDSVLWNEVVSGRLTGFKGRGPTRVVGSLGGVLREGTLVYAIELPGRESSVWGSQRPPPTAKPIGKGGGRSPPSFSI